MKKMICLLSFLFISRFLSAQQSADQSKDSLLNIYRSTATRVHDLVHTKLEVQFDFTKSYLNGKAWITLKPHGYATDSLSLDAKGMDIHQVAVITGTGQLKLKYNYNGLVLTARLNRTYKAGEQYTVYIDYTSKPNTIKMKASEAITGAKGLYFINPLGTDKDKPTQIWTQGETEANSVWFPTIDKPNQKTTEEIIMTVPDKYVTLSNGKLVSQKKNAGGTRTDDWKMDLPHAPYLFFMGVGEYSIVKDSYKGKDVHYYVEKQFAPVARRIFGHTPEMIAFYSKITGIDFPWAKYDQITGRDYVSGAMENTTATLHQESAQQDARELVDGNAWEDVIAHELFHQWFGDLVTAESWSNITLNESFADFSETLWNEHKYGKDAGDAINYAGMRAYLNNPQNANKNLVRFHYDDKEDVFDAVSYSKGGRILNMLRNYVGDSAFFKALNLYLNVNKFKSAEAQQLRLAFEEVTGKDLNWYWNQWYYGSGHPKLDINYQYDDTRKTVMLTIAQTQDGAAFRVPIAIDIFNGAQKTRHEVWLENKTDSFTFGYSTKPDLVNVDGDKIVLCEKKDHKTLDNFIHQYKYAGSYLDRREAIDYCALYPEDPKAMDLLKKAAAGDRFYGLRMYALDQFDFKNEHTKTDVEGVVAAMAKNDPKTVVRAKAIELLGQYKNPAYKPVFEKAVLDSSYSVSGAALEALSTLDPESALTFTKKLMHQPAKGNLAAAISAVLIKDNDTSNVEIISQNFKKINDIQAKLDLLPGFASLLLQIQNDESFKNGIDLIVNFRNNFPGAQHEEMAAYINKDILQQVVEFKDRAGLKDHVEYVKSKIN